MSFQCDNRSAKMYWIGATRNFNNFLCRFEDFNIKVLFGGYSNCIESIFWYTTMQEMRYALVLLHVKVDFDKGANSLEVKAHQIDMQNFYFNMQNIESVLVTWNWF